MTSLKKDPKRIWSRRYMNKLFRVDPYHGTWFGVAWHREIKLVINMEFNRVMQVERRNSK